MKSFVVLAVLAALLLAVPVASSRPARTHAVARVVDGDTLVLGGGQRVRLVQIDAPEVRGDECYSRAARSMLARLLPPGTRVTLELDPRLDRRGRYGRTLAYAWKGRENVNVTLVARGAASVWFYGGVRGKHATALMRAAVSARSAKRGLWGACPGTRLDPTSAVSTSAAAVGTGGGKCDSSYPDICIAPPPPDLDCKDVGRTVRVRPPDPHRLDGDGDGWGCESYG